MITENVMRVTRLSAVHDQEYELTPPLGYSGCFIFAPAGGSKFWLRNKCTTCKIAVIATIDQQGHSEIIKERIEAKSQMIFDVSAYQMTNIIDDEDCPTHYETDPALP